MTVKRSRIKPELFDRVMFLKRNSHNFIDIHSPADTPDIPKYLKKLITCIINLKYCNFLLYVKIIILIKSLALMFINNTQESGGDFHRSNFLNL